MATVQEKLRFLTSDVSGHWIVRVAGQIDSTTAPRFEMFALTPVMSRMIEISCLTSILSIHASEEEALAALGRA
jgi:hypothetical protein